LSNEEDPPRPNLVLVVSLVVTCSDERANVPISPKVSA
jgi:hypothetical protein